LTSLELWFPYRDRKDHLSQFIPHVCDFFARDKHNSGLDVRIIIVEQPPGLPFNRGLICNIGYRIVCEHTGYICFHDVDYLPVSADYSCPALPTMIIRHGFEFHSIDPRLLFSAVVLLQNQHFERANGFSNDYWGWGFEDIDLKQRLTAAGLSTGHRAGTFTPLHHVQEGSTPDGRPTHAKARNAAQRVRRWLPPATLWKREGLNTAEFSIAHRTTIIPRGKSNPIFVEHILVEFAHRPRFGVALGERIMPDREELRATAARCLALARSATDPRERVALTGLARTFYKMAGDPPGE
jgi:glycosyl transferase family 7 (putative galactosyltransferase)